MQTLKTAQEMAQKMKALNRWNIAKSVADDLDWTVQKSKRAVDAYYEAIFEGLVRDGELTIQYLGWFQVRERIKRERYQLGVTKKPGPYNFVFFRPASYVRGLVNRD